MKFQSMNYGLGVARVQDTPHEYPRCIVCDRICPERERATKAPNKYCSSACGSRARRRRYRGEDIRDNGIPNRRLNPQSPNSKPRGQA